MLPASAAANTYVVNTTKDHALGACTKADCTLREAVLAANDHAGLDTVEVKGGKTYKLKGAPNDDVGTTGDLDVNDKLTLTAVGKGRATIDANGVDRAIDVFKPTTLKGLVITGGNPPGASGGGIRGQARTDIIDSKLAGNQTTAAGGAASLTAGGSLTHTVVTGNTASSNGGGLVLDGTADHPFLVSHSTISGNHSPLGPGALLGGNVKLLQSRVTDNHGDGFCGGVDLSGNVALIQTVVAGNQSSGGPGGGVCASGSGTALRMNRSTVRNNVAGGGVGGGMSINANGLTATITRSTVSKNTASGNGGGIFASTVQPLTITRSTIDGNQSHGNGGGLEVESASTLELTNSTIAGNMADANGGGLRATDPMGGNDNELHLDFSTIADNVADFDGMGGGMGGGFSQGIGAIFHSHGSLIALNQAASDPDCNDGGVQSGGHNLVGDVTNCLGFTGPGDIVNPNPKIGPLGPNGGPTETIPLKKGSPAIDAGGKKCPKTDQRGVKRPQGKACDIGAFERQ